VEAPACGFGDEQVRRDARLETSIRARAGITSVVPWLVVSDTGSAMALGPIGPCVCKSVWPSATMRCPYSGESGIWPPDRGAW
jgi:hypothetical protein